MASEASVVDQATDGIGEKVIDDAKVVEGENAFLLKEPGESEAVEKTIVKEQASSETAEADSKDSIENEKDGAPAAEEGKKENEVDEASASAVAEDKKDNGPTVDEVKKENEDAEVSSAVVMESITDDISVAEVVKVETEAGKTSSPDESEIEASKIEPEREPRNTTESTSETVDTPLVESEVSSVQESEQVKQKPEVYEPVAETAKATAEPSGNQAVASETTTLSKEQTIALAVMQSAPDASGELEKKSEAPETTKVVEASTEPEVPTVEVETGPEHLKSESDVKVTGGSSAVTDLVTVPGDPAEVSEAKAVGSKYAFPVNTEKADDDVNASGSTEETKNEESERVASDSLVKVVTVDTNLPDSSTIVGETEKSDASSVTQAAETVVKPDINVVEQREVISPITEAIEECDEVKTVETETVEELKEEKNVTSEATLTDTKEFRNLSDPVAELVEATTKDKPSEGSEKAVEEQRDMGSSELATEVTEICSEKHKSSEVAEKIAEGVKVEKVRDETAVIQTSRDLDVQGSNGADISTKEPVDKSEGAEETDTGNRHKDETEEKKDDTEKNDTQDLVETSKEGVESKVDVEVQKPESPAKHKTLISKVKHSVVKLKKAIIGKSPGSKTTSAESKDESKIK